MTKIQTFGGGGKYTPQSSTITVKSPYVINVRTCLNFGVCDVHGQIPKTDIMRHTFYLVIFVTICAKLVLI